MNGMLSTATSRKSPDTETPSRVIFHGRPRGLTSTSACIRTASISSSRFGRPSSGGWLLERLDAAGDQAATDALDEPSLAPRAGGAAEIEGPAPGRGPGGHDLIRRAGDLHAAGDVVGGAVGQDRQRRGLPRQHPGRGRDGAIATGGHHQIRFRLQDARRIVTGADDVHHGVAVALDRLRQVVDRSAFAGIFVVKQRHSQMAASSGDNRDRLQELDPRLHRAQHAHTRVERRWHLQSRYRGARAGGVGVR